MLQIPIRFTAIASLVFAAGCLWLAIDGFTSPPDNAGPESISGGRSFAWFWVFLAGVGLAMAWLSWKLGGRRQDEDG